MINYDVECVFLILLLCIYIYDSHTPTMVDVCRYDFPLRFTSHYKVRPPSSVRQLSDFVNGGLTLAPWG